MQIELDKTALKPSRTMQATALSVAKAGHGNHKVKLALAHNGFGIHLVMDREQADWLCGQIAAAFQEDAGDAD